MGRAYSSELLTELRNSGIEHATFAEDGSLLSVTFSDTVTAQRPDASDPIDPTDLMAPIRASINKLSQSEQAKEMVLDLIEQDAEDIVKKYLNKIQYGT